MKIAYFDCQFGAAGDMLLGALVGAGLPVAQWFSELKKIALPANSFKLEIEDVLRCSIASKKVHVRVVERRNGVADHGEHEPEKTLPEIVQIIEQSAITSEAKNLAKSIFRRLAEAEANVHGLPLEQVHFHEVGAVDAIVDIVGFAVAYDLLKIEKCFVSPLPLGSGTVKTAHGLLPVPGPAVTYLLGSAQAPIKSANFQHECLTPTGAAILTAIACGWGAAPDLDHLISTGYGAGDFNPSQFPNVCRLIIGESSTHTLSPLRDDWQSGFTAETIVVLETNLDDFTPQALSFTAEQLFKLGALDVFITPCLMKKGRSGHQLTVLSYPLEGARLEEYILRQTTTLGVRKYLAERTILLRKWQEVSMPDGHLIRVKVAFDRGGNIVHSQPEYEDCAAYALSLGLPIQEVFNQVITGLAGSLSPGKVIS